MDQRTSQSGTREIRACSLAQLLDVLGQSVLRLLTAPAGLSAPVTEALVHDVHTPLPRTPDGLLLAVGVRPAEPEAHELVRAAGAAGLAALVVKEYGGTAAALAAAAEAHGVAVLAVDEDVSWHHLHLLIASTLNAPRTVAGTAGGAALGDLFSLANALAAAIGGATAIEDPRQRIFAYSTLPDQPVDEDRRQGILGLQVPDGPENSAQYRMLYRGPGVCRLPAVGDGLPRLAVAVRAGGETLGSIWVVDTGTLAKDAEEVLAQGASMAALHLLQARAAEELVRRQHGDLLRRVLDGGASAALVAPQLGLREDDPVRVVAFALAGDLSVPSGEQAALRLVELVRLQCEARYGQHACVLVGGIVYALLPVPDERSEGRQRGLAADIARQAGHALRVPVVAGLGGVVRGLAEATASRVDADLVLRILTGGGRPDGPVAATVAELRSKVTLLRLGELLADRPQLAEGPWRRVLAHDAEHGTEYARTYLAYLDAGCDMARAARLLAVHPNTCRYRLRQAQAQLGIDVEDPDERLVLWLHLRTLARTAP
ncbi:PucR family transcriptional regulator [Streptomyces sp. NPDC059590]|uniref:PucR family transcriptional regulator n=1 Tax=Streptomyces sp. NPDC059590 TaxID=3346877 RepID=UPI00368A5209